MDGIRVENGRRFEVVVASDVTRDGLGVELVELLGDDQRHVVMKVFRFDDQESFEIRPLRTALTFAAGDVPLHLAREFLSLAEEKLGVADIHGL